MNSDIINAKIAHTKFQVLLYINNIIIIPTIENNKLNNKRIDKLGIESLTNIVIKRQPKPPLINTIKKQNTCSKYDR